MCFAYCSGNNVHSLAAPRPWGPLPASRWRVLVAVAFMVAAVCWSGTAVSAAHRDRHVVVISLDGFPADIWAQPDLPVPNLRRLAADGAAAERMTVTNVASTWSSHTSMITSRSSRYHGVFFNGQVTRRGPGRVPTIEQWADKDGFVLVPTLYDLAFAAGLTTAESDWVAITRAPTITWSFPEIPSVEGKVERAMIAAGLLTEEQVGWMQHRPGRKSIVWHDEMWTKAACFMIRQYQPNLLLYHPLTTDSNHHNYGHGSDAGYVALAYADRLVGDIVQAVDDAGLHDRTTFIVMTDHGFKKVSRYIHANVVLKQAGLARSAGPELVDCQAAVLSLGGTAFVYLTDPAKKQELLPRMRELLTATEGIAQVIDGSEGPTLGLPTPEENDRMGDLILVAKDGYLFNNSPAPEKPIMPTVSYAGTHGYPASDPEMDGIFIASGAQIKRGVVLPRVSNLDLAPTIAHVLGLEMPDAEGRVLEEILLPSATK